MIPLSIKANKDEEQELIEQIINLLKEHPVVKDLFSEFKVPLDQISNIDIEFSDLDVSAKAKNGKIYINRQFLEDGNIIDDVHYIVHELVHILQQLCGAVADFDPATEHYLDDPSEIAAFNRQIKFIDSYKSPEEADKYVDDLLDFHEFSGTDRKRKRKQLRGE